MLVVLTQLGQIWTNPNVGFKMKCKILTQSLVHILPKVVLKQTSSF